MTRLRKWLAEAHRDLVVLWYASRVFGWRGLWRMARRHGRR